jgi:proline iminopeptidase
MADLVTPIAKQGTITLDGFQLRYTIEGTGISALVIGSAIYYPRTFSSNLRAHLKMIFIDHRGFVPCSQSVETASYTLDTIVEDIETIRKQLNIDCMIVIGHSGHAYMAQAYAKKYPQRVSHLILIAAGPNHSAECHAAAEQYLQDSVCPERKAFLEQSLKDLPQALAADPDRRFITYCLRLGARSWYDFAFDATSLWQGVLVNMAIIDHFWGQVFRDIDITQGIERLSMPVLLMLGRYDYLVAPPYSWNNIRTKFTDLTVRVFEQSGHIPQYEQSDDLARFFDPLSSRGFDLVNFERA